MSTMMLSNMIRHYLADDSAGASSETSYLADLIPHESTAGSTTFTTPALGRATDVTGSPVPKYRGRGANRSTSRKSLLKKQKPTNLVFENQEDFERWVNTRGKHNHRVTEEQEKWLWSVTGIDAIGNTNWERCSQEFFKLFDEKWNGSRLMMEWYRMDRKMKTIAGLQPHVTECKGVSAKDTDTSLNKEQTKQEVAVTQITAPSASRKRSSRGQRVNYAEDTDCDPEDDLGSVAGLEMAADEELGENVHPNLRRVTRSKELVIGSTTLYNMILSPQPYENPTQTGFTPINGPQKVTNFDTLGIPTIGHVQSGAQEIPSTTALIPSTLDRLTSPISGSTEFPTMQDNLTSENDCSIQSPTEIENGLTMEDQNLIEALDPRLLQTTRAIRRSARLSSTIKPPPPKVLDFKNTAVNKKRAVDCRITDDLPNPPATPAAKRSLIPAQVKFMRIYTYSATIGQRHPDADITFGPSVLGNIPSQPTTMTEGLVEILQALGFSPIHRDIIIFTDCAEALREVTAATFRAEGYQDTDAHKGENGELLRKILGALKEREEANSKTRFEWIEGLRGKAIHPDAKL